MIEIAFCFDKNMVTAACVAIASLLDFNTDRATHYRISCICPEEAFDYKPQIESIVLKRDNESRVDFYLAPKEFCGAYRLEESQSVRISDFYCTEYFQIRKRSFMQMLICFFRTH